MRYAFEGFDVHAWTGGRGFPLLLLHGSGPGASAIGNWRAVLDDLAARYRVLAIDLIGFGESDRKPAPPYFDVPLWQRQVADAIGRLETERVGVVAHSISAALALRQAAADPRVVKLVTTGAMGAAMPVNAFLDLVWRCPASRDAMRETAATLIADRALITDEYLDARMRIIGAPGYREYFDAMFAGPFERFIDTTVVSEPDLERVTCDVTLLHGREDVAFPERHTSRPLAERLANADLVSLARCSHSVALERRDTFLAHARMMFG
jgi:2-hydroxymuconate-semialdehyde hydrolase